MWGSIKYNLAHLLDFKGRDARPTFWYFFLFVFLVSMAISIVAVIPAMATMMSRIFELAQNDPAMAERMMPAIMAEMMQSIVWTSIVSGALYLFLLAAAFVRRLHDSNLSGWWAALPGALYAIALARMPAQMKAMTDAFANLSGSTDPMEIMRVSQQQNALNALIGWTPIIIFIILGIRESTKGPNRHGEGPVSL